MNVLDQIKIRARFSYVHSTVVRTVELYIYNLELLDNNDSDNDVLEPYRAYNDWCRYYCMWFDIFLPVSLKVVVGFGFEDPHRVGHSIGVIPKAFALNFTTS